MGDIIWGTFIFIAIAILINKKLKHSDTERLIRLILGVGSMLGLFISFTQDRPGKAMGILLFYFQLASIIMISINKNKTAYIILLITLLLQIPILQFDGFSYRSQTLFGFNIQQFPGKYVDLEPGSYVSYFDKPYYRPFPFGINLISLILFFYFIRSKILWTKKKKHQQTTW